MLWIGKLLNSHALPLTQFTPSFLTSILQPKWQSIYVGPLSPWLLTSVNHSTYLIIVNLTSTSFNEIVSNWESSKKLSLLATYMKVLTSENQTGKPQLGFQQIKWRQIIYQILLFLHLWIPLLLSWEFLSLLIFWSYIISFSSSRHLSNPYPECSIFLIIFFIWFILCYIVVIIVFNHFFVIYCFNIFVIFMFVDFLLIIIFNFNVFFH